MIDKPHHPKRKKIRLDREIYADPGTIISLTVATQERRPVFAEPSITSGCLDVLRRITDDHRMNVLVYCFMHDHLHVLLENAEGSDLVAFMRQFKSWSTRIAWQHGVDGKLWQRSYYDHVLREDEDISGYIRYILGNPVRHDLVTFWNEYPWAGSFVYDFSDPTDWPS